ncbi:aminopeptidase P family protein [Undibacterium sp. LX40W]|uniref:Aminopeptidase P family protein n=1 Tax=Undibacterium nitidum TaxID=2762298 RepID=A0A923HR35_9BURK|nr:MULTISPECIES: M24 family metallopeptidase [Undibacterium]MBC3883033.1 aminopeptidase P family protein [Undibacterium nitidum]MBC3893314.1 aminopeptidase P family protein [Undibacterium sp. LX40W]
MKKFLLALSLCSALAYGSADAQILSVREQARVVNENLAERFDRLLPGMMEQTGIDMWVVISREYNEDPVLKTMLPAEWLNARRRTILVFFQDSKTKKVERLAVARYDFGDNVKAAWDTKKFPDQWDALIDLIQKRQPNKIGINTSTHFAHADGLDHTEYQEFQNKLPANLKSKVVSAEPLAIRWLETRTAREMQFYPQLIRTTHEIIEEGFSEKVIVPGITTSEDVVWWFRQKIRDLGYDTWFHPTVDIQRADPNNDEAQRSFSNRPKTDVILPGDLIHVDIGITYLRLNTDIQQHAYILRPGETSVPESIKTAFARGNRLQDILTMQFKEGKTGNQVLADALAQAKKEGIVPSIYSHPIGYHGHAAGPALGMWDQQDGVPGTGEQQLRKNTAYSIELNATSMIPEWKKSIRIMLEEDAFFDGEKVRYIDGRQKEIYVIPRFDRFNQN